MSKISFTKPNLVYVFRYVFAKLINVFCFHMFMRIYNEILSSRVADINILAQILNFP